MIFSINVLIDEMVGIWGYNLILGDLFQRNWKYLEFVFYFLRVRELLLLFVRVFRYIRKLRGKKY